MLIRTIVGAIGVGLVGLSAQVPALAQDIDVAAEIEKVRQAAQKYEDVNVALAEGYIVAPPGDCVTAAHEGLPAEWGGMGVHYIHPAKLKITGVEPRVNGESTHTSSGEARSFRRRRKSLITIAEIASKPYPTTEADSV